MRPTSLDEIQHLCFPFSDKAIVPYEIRKIPFHIAVKDNRYEIIFASIVNIKETFEAICRVFHDLNVGIKYVDTPFIHLELDKLGTIMWKKFINNYVFFDKNFGYYCTYFKIDRTGCLLFNAENIN